MNNPPGAHRKETRSAVNHGTKNQENEKKKKKKQGAAVNDGNLKDIEPTPWPMPPRLPTMKYVDAAGKSSNSKEEEANMNKMHTEESVMNALSPLSNSLYTTSSPIPITSNLLMTSNEKQPPALRQLPVVSKTKSASGATEDSASYHTPPSVLPGSKHNMADGKVNRMADAVFDRLSRLYPRDKSSSSSSSSSGSEASVVLDIDVLDLFREDDDDNENDSDHHVQRKDDTVRLYRSKQPRPRGVGEQSFLNVSGLQSLFADEARPRHKRSRSEDLPDSQHLAGVDTVVRSCSTYGVGAQKGGTPGTKKKKKKKKNTDGKKKAGASGHIADVANTGSERKHTHVEAGSKSRSSSRQNSFSSDTAEKAPLRTVPPVVEKQDRNLTDSSQQQQQHQQQQQRHGQNDQTALVRSSSKNIKTQPVPPPKAVQTVKKADDGKQGTHQTTRSVNDSTNEPPVPVRDNLLGNIDDLSLVDEIELDDVSGNDIVPPKPRPRLVRGRTGVVVRDVPERLRTVGMRRAETGFIMSRAELQRDGPPTLLRDNPNPKSLYFPQDVLPSSSQEVDDVMQVDEYDSSSSSSESPVVSPKPVLKKLQQQQKQLQQPQQPLQQQQQKIQLQQQQQQQQLQQQQKQQQQQLQQQQQQKQQQQQQQLKQQQQHQDQQQRQQQQQYQQKKKRPPAPIILQPQDMKLQSTAHSPNASSLLDEPASRSLVSLGTNVASQSSSGSNGRFKNSLSPLNYIRSSSSSASNNAANNNTTTIAARLNNGIKWAKRAVDASVKMAMPSFGNENSNADSPRESNGNVSDLTLQGSLDECVLRICYVCRELVGCRKVEVRDTGRKIRIEMYDQKRNVLLKLSLLLRSTEGNTATMVKLKQSKTEMQQSNIMSLFEFYSRLEDSLKVTNFSKPQY